MPFNGSGVFNLSYNWNDDKTAGIKITASRMQAQDADMASGLTKALTKDGQTVPTADLPMGGYKHTGVANGAARNQYPSVAQVQDGSVVTAADTGSADAYVITLTPAITAYATGQLFWVKVANTNTGASTLNVNGVGTKTVKKGGTTDVAAGDLEADKVYGFHYDGTNFQLVSAVVPTVSTSFTDSTFEIKDNTDSTKKMAFQLSGVSTATTRTVTIPDKDGTLAMTSDIPSGGVPLINDGYYTGKYYYGGFHESNGSNAGADADRLNFVPFIVGKETTFDRIGINATSATAGNIRFGIYNSTNNLPSTLLVDLGVVATGGTTGYKELTISQTLPAGLYWLACVRSAAINLEDMRVMEPSFSGHHFGYPDRANGASNRGYYQSHTYGSLPASASGLTGGTGNAPFIYMRAA